MPFSLARTWPARYELLDGLRGLACIGVLLQHLGVLTIGHYCVMTFFVISGYCITASAQSAIRTRLSFWRFMQRRFRRIYPPYLVAVLLFALTRLIRNTFHFSPTIWHAGLLEWMQNLTLTQWLSDLTHPVYWPSENRTLFVAAFWSLNYEEQFYLVVGVALMLAYRWRDLRVSVLTLLVLGLIWDTLHPGGPLTGLFIEYWPHFALGACLFFTLTGSAGVASRLLFLGAAGLLATISFLHLLPWHGPSTETSERFYVEFAVLSLISIALVLLRPFSQAITRNPLWRPAALVGVISYSLYLVHQFNLTIVDKIVESALSARAPIVLLVPAKVLVHVLLATAFWYLFERPFLNRRPPSLDTDPLSGTDVAVDPQAARQLSNA